MPIISIILLSVNILFLIVRLIFHFLKKEIPYSNTLSSALSFSFGISSFVLVYSGFELNIILYLSLILFLVFTKLIMDILSDFNIKYYLNHKLMIDDIYHFFRIIIFLIASLFYFGLNLTFIIFSSIFAIILYLMLYVFKVEIKDNKIGVYIVLLVLSSILLGLLFNSSIFTIINSERRSAIILFISVSIIVFKYIIKYIFINYKNTELNKNYYFMDLVESLSYILIPLSMLYVFDF